MATEKITKVQMFTEIMTFLATTDWAMKDEAGEFIAKQIEQLEAKAAKAKSKAAEKRAEGDALRATVLGCLTDEAQTIDEITAAVVEATGDTEITKAKVTARLTQLVNADQAVKEQAKVETRKIMTYKLAVPVVAEAEVEDDLPAEE